MKDQALTGASLPRQASVWTTGVLATPTETREFPNGRLDLLRIGGSDIGRLTWRRAGGGPQT